MATDITSTLLGKDRWIKDLGLRVLRHPATAKIAGAMRYDLRMWDDIVRSRTVTEWLRALQPEAMDALEISGKRWQDFGFGSYRSLAYPAFDICQDRVNERYDLVLADHVFEHIRYPHRAAQNVAAMLKPGGYFLMCTPFLVKVHPSPIDCYRWTEDGMRYFLEESGFEDVRTGSWGNKACVKSLLRIWMPRGWSSLKNDPEFPVVVWALARRHA
jgi:SAM-dependent methyltransferase